jgi:hypothetical protein
MAYGTFLRLAGLNQVVFNGGHGNDFGLAGNFRNRFLRLYTPGAGPLSSA